MDYAEYEKSPSVAVRKRAKGFILVPIRARDTVRTVLLILSSIAISLIPNAGECASRVFDRNDFLQSDINHGVRVGAGGIVLQKHKFDEGRTFRWTGPGYAGIWVDPTTGDIYLPTYQRPPRGLVIVYADGTAAAYRRSGVWDVTGDIEGEGTLITSSVKLSGDDRCWSVWKEVETGEVYLATYNGGLNIIHTYNTRDYGDDTVEVISGDTSPGLFIYFTEMSWKDDQGNLYVGLAGYGFTKLAGGVTIISPDGTSISYTQNGVWDTSVGDERKLISDSPTIGAYIYYIPGGPDWAHTRVYFRDDAGNLYMSVGANGLTVLLWNPDMGRYDRSLNYRPEGLYDTTEDNIGILMDASRSLPYSGVSDVWQDDNGDIYVSCLSSSGRKPGPGSIIHPDGTVTTPVELGYHRWKDNAGNLYVSWGRFLSIVYADGITATYYPKYGARASWTDMRGYLYVRAALLSGMDIVPPNKSGWFISAPFGANGLPLYRTITWDAQVPEGTSLKFQIRTASTEDELDDAPWVGPMDSRDFYTISGAPINPTHNGHRWLQWRAILETEDPMRTPLLRGVEITYDLATEVEDRPRNPLPQATSLDQNYPNPFNAETAIRYQLSREGGITLSIYNTLGQEIRKLVDAHQESGYYDVVWDGRDREGRDMGSGVYFCILEANEYRRAIKLLLIR